MDATRARPRVLVVEPELYVRGVVTTALEAVGYAVVEVGDAAAALAECRRRDPEVIVLDVQLPDMDGAALLAAYRHIPGARARIVAVSAIPRGGRDGGQDEGRRVRLQALLGRGSHRRREAATGRQLRVARQLVWMVLGATLLRNAAHASESTRYTPHRWETARW